MQLFYLKIVYYSLPLYCLFRLFLFCIVLFLIQFIKDQANSSYFNSIKLHKNKISFHKLDNSNNLKIIDWKKFYTLRQLVHSGLIIKT